MYSIHNVIHCKYMYIDIEVLAAELYLSEKIFGQIRDLICPNSFFQRATVLQLLTY